MMPRTLADHAALGLGPKNLSWREFTGLPFAARFGDARRMPCARITLTTQFESAHFLPHVPEGHRCRRLHGHTFRCDIEVRGDLIEPEGWVLDFGVMEERVDAVIKHKLDHRLLNDIEGLENPTSERLALWLWHALVSDLPGLLSVSVWENPRMHAQVTADDVND